MIDVVVLGCGPIWTGEGVAAPFIGVHILGDIRPAGGFVTQAESRWEDQIGPSIPVQKSTIPQTKNYGRRGGFKASLNCNRVDKFDRSTWSLASKT